LGSGGTVVASAGIKTGLIGVEHEPIVEIAVKGELRAKHGSS
jgi:hypothetical protein